MRLSAPGRWRANPAGLAFVRHVYIETADPVDMQNRVAASLAEFAAIPLPAQWVLTHADLAGGGDGHTFVTRLEFVDLNGAPNVEVDGGIPPNVARFLYYMASQSEALLPARRALQAQVAALLVPPVVSVILAQTGLAGAVQGKRFMGMLILGLSID